MRLTLGRSTRTTIVLQLEELYSLPNWKRPQDYVVQYRRLHLPTWDVIIGMQ